MQKNSLALASILHEYEPANLPGESLFLTVSTSLCLSSSMSLSTHTLPVTPYDWMDAMEKMLGDYHFTCNVNEMALAHTKHGGDTYYYYFTHRFILFALSQGLKLFRATAQTWPHWMGVLHGYEINFIFGEPYNKKFNYTAEEQELSSRFMRYWANFARTG